MLSFQTAMSYRNYVFQSTKHAIHYPRCCFQEGFMRKYRAFVAFCGFIFSMLVILSDAQALPNFARKYNADCSMCHFIPPQLNRLGYEFRAAAFRLPSEIGKDEKPFKLGDFFSASISEQYTWQKHKNNVDPTDNFKTSQLEFNELALFPLSGSWGRYFGSFVLISMTPDNTFDIENAYVRGVYGNENGWFYARVGVMSPVEGYGASDEPLGTIGPLFKSEPAIGSPFILAELNQSAAEVGYSLARTGTDISFRVTNGIFWKEGEASPAQGGSLTKPQDEPAANNKDLQVVLNQFYAENDAITLYYYRGAVPFPDPGSGSPLTKDIYHRFAAYANFWAIPESLNLLGGYEYGRDSLADGTVAGGSDVGKNTGYFGEVDFHIVPHKFAVGARYDYFRPSNNVPDDRITAYTFSFNSLLVAGLQFIGDFQHKKTELADGHTTDDTAVAMLMFTW